MSSSDRSSQAAFPGRAALTAGLLLALVAVAGCTARPLYGDMTASTAGQSATTARLASIGIKPAQDRVGQEVRNHLIFLLAGGQGQPANPVYSLDLTTVVRESRPVEVSTGRVALVPTAGTVTVRGAYRLTDAASGELISAGARAAQAAYDIPDQSFAALRAERDAENRAARELAEQLRLAIAQELEQRTSTAVPTVLSDPEELQERLDEEAFQTFEQTR